MTTPYRRGSGPVQTGASGASGASGGSGATGPFDYLPPAWNEQWILKPPVDTANEVDLTAGPPMSSWGASGASGASGSSGGSRPGGVDGQTSIQTDRLSGIHYRNQNIVSAVYGDALPMLNAWENAGDALFNVLLAGFGGIEEFIETLVKILTGAEVDLSFISVGAREFLEILQTIFGPIGQIFEWIWENIGEPILRGIFEVLKYAWDFFEGIAESLGIDVQAIFESVTQILGVAFGVFGDAVEAILQPLSDFLKWLFETFGGVVESFLKPIGTWLFGIWQAIGEPLLSNIASFLAGLWDTIGEPTLTAIFGTLGAIWNIFDQVVIDNIVDLFAALTDNRNLLDFVEDIIAFFANVIQDAGSLAAGIPLFGNLVTLASEILSEVFETVGGWVLGIINGLTGGLFSVITEALGAVINWASNLFLIGPALQALIPEEWRNTVGRPAASFADLKEYAAETLNTSSALYSANLQGPIPVDLLPVVSPGLVGDGRPNLIADAGFRSATAVQAGSGWSWDSSVSRTSADGGSAKVAGDGGVKRMFSNLIAVSPGQELECSVWARWTKQITATPTISVGLRGYINDQVVFTQDIASKANVTQNSASFAGNVGGWVEIKGNYAIPETQGLTHVRLMLSVVNAPSGVLVWFDDAALRKVSLIGPRLVGGVGDLSQNLADDIENTVGSDQYQLLLDRVAKKTGASLADVQATINDFLDGDSTVSGDQIRAGNIASTYIEELRDTWDTVRIGIDGPAAPTGNDLAAAFTALDGWRLTFGDHGSGISDAIAAANAANARMTQVGAEFGELKRYVQLVADDVRRVTIQAGLTPTTPPTVPGTPPPTIASVRDDFNRTTLGVNWATSQKISNYGGLITDGKNAVFSMPDFDGFLTLARRNVFAATYSGGNSLSDYQRVYMTLGSAPGRPAVGTVGYNDLIGRAKSDVICMVARFYNDAARTVKLFWRNGAYEVDPYAPSNTFATFSRPSNSSLTAGTNLEFLVGARSSSDASRCSVKIGSWTSAVYTSSASLSLLGRGWGFGGGNGDSGTAVQKPATVDSWGAEDQQ